MACGNMSSESLTCKVGMSINGMARRSWKASRPSLHSCRQYKRSWTSLMSLVSPPAAAVLHRPCRRRRAHQLCVQSRDGFKLNSCAGTGSTRVCMCARTGWAQVRVRLLSDVLGQPHFPLPRGLSVRGQAMLGDGPLNTIGQAPPPHSLVVWAESVWFPRGGWVNNQNSRLLLDRDEMGIICFVWVCGWMDGWVCGCAGA